MIELLCKNLFKKAVNIMETNYSKLRTTAFGGFNKKDVVAYIEKIQNEAYENKLRIEKETKELNEQISELLKAADDAVREKDMLLEKIEELSAKAVTAPVDEGKNETLSEINEATNHLKSVADELCESLREFMERISENSYSVVIGGDSTQCEESFDGEKLMAELEAEIYAKLGVEDTAAEEKLVERAEPKEDPKVNSILSVVSAFSDKEKTEPEIKNENNETVTNILGSLSFLK